MNGSDSIHHRLFFVVPFVRFQILSRSSHSHKLTCLEEPSRNADFLFVSPENGHQRTSTTTTTIQNPFTIHNYSTGTVPGACSSTPVVPSLARPHMSSMSNAGRIFWKIGSPPPAELSCKNPFLATLIPRTAAWFSVDDERVALLDGYNACCYTPPTIIFGIKTLPPAMIAKLMEAKVCTMSSATVRESQAAYQKAACLEGDIPQDFTFDELGMKARKSKQGYPAAVDAAPIKMHCSLNQIVNFDGTSDGESMIILTVETFLVDGSALSPPTEIMAGRDIKAKIDAELIQPVVSLGNGIFAPLAGLRSMPRPQKQNDGGWVSNAFEGNPPTVGTSNYGAMEWSYKVHGPQCPLGFNPITALIMPRSIGWISTYKKDGRIPHIAPYSFFVDVARGKQPMVVFSGARKNGEIKKDAQTDAEDMGCFVYNMVSEDLAVAMNYSAAEMGRNESEFELAGLAQEKATIVDAPVVKDAHVKYECEYIQTVDIASFSLVIGKVVGISVDASVLTNGRVDHMKARPITRLGYMNEYGILK